MEPGDIFQSNRCVIIYFSLSALIDFLFRFLHCEAEIPFISFDELLAHLENLLVDVCEKLMASEHAGSILKLNPEFKVPKKPFRRMNYSDAIIYLKEYGITKSKEDKSFFVYGEVCRIHLELFYCLHAGL